MNYRILIVLSVIAAIVSIFIVSQATSGVWMIGIAVLLAAYARIAQAEAHHNGMPEEKMTTKNADSILKSYKQKAP